LKKEEKEQHCTISIVIMVPSTSSEVTPLIRNVGSNTVSFHSYTKNNNGDTTTAAPINNGHSQQQQPLPSPSSSSFPTSSSSFLQMTYQRSASTFSEAMSGMKRIGYLGSLSISVNSLTGPAM
jgi:hypothetical protein